MLRPFLEGLAHKLGTGPAHMDPTALTASLLNGCDAAIALQLVGALKAVALGAERGDQAWCEGWAHARKRAHNGKVRMRFGQFLDALLIVPNGLPQGLQVLHQ